VIGTDIEAYPNGYTPISQLRLLSGGAMGDWYASASGVCSSSPPYAEINGVWGIHRDYVNAWYAIDTLSANITDSATTFTISSVIGGGYLGITPRLSGGALVKIDSEFLLVQSANKQTGVVTVADRGANGTTAAAHTQGATVYVWRTDGAVRRAVARQTALNLSRLGAYNTVEITGGGEVRYPADWLWEVKNTLQRYAYGS
jgi:hypothetical protein